MYVMHTWNVYAWDEYIYVWKKWKKYGYAMYAWNDTIMIYIYMKCYDMINVHKKEWRDKAYDTMNEQWKYVI